MCLADCAAGLQLKTEEQVLSQGVLRTHADGGNDPERKEVDAVLAETLVAHHIGESPQKNTQQIKTERAGIWAQGTEIRD